MKKILLILCCFLVFPVLAANDLSGYIYGKAMMGDLDGLFILKNQGYSLETKDEYGNTPYCLAVFRRNQTAIRTLEQAGVNINPRCLQTIPIVTEAMIYEAAHNRNVQQISLWQKYGVPVDLVNQFDQNTALCEAVYKKDCAAIDVLLKAGASEYHNCMRRIPQKVRQELDCKPIVIDWERVGLTALGAGLVAGGLAVMLSGGGSSGSSCAINQHWDGEKCVTCPDMQCWDGQSCRVAYQGEYTDPRTNRCMKIAPPPYTDGTYEADSFKTNEYDAGGFLGTIKASAAYAHGYSGYIISRWNDKDEKSYFGALKNGQSSIQGGALDITSNRYRVGVLSTGTDINNVPKTDTNGNIVVDDNNKPQYIRYVNKDLAYEEDDEEGKIVWKGNLAQNSAGLYGYNFDYGYFEHVNDAERRNYYTSGTKTDFIEGYTGDSDTVYLVLHGDECNATSGYCGLASADGVSALPYRIVDLAECGIKNGSSVTRCLAPPADIDGYRYTMSYSGSVPYVYEDNENNPAPHYYLNGEDSKSRSWNQGTMLAGIIAALKNDLGMHGVAYNTEVIPAVADIIRPVTNNAIDTLITGGANIILQDVIFTANANYPTASSVRLKTISETYGADTAAAYSRVANSGTIYIVGTGTSGYNNISSGLVSYYDPDPNDPTKRYTKDYEKDASISALAPLATDGEALSKLFLSVTAVQENSAAETGYTLTTYAQPCGSTASYCLSAPGGTGTPGTAGSNGNLYSTISTVAGAANEYNWGEDYGTSAAAAVVAGAAALLKGAYPHLSSQEVVSLLKQTATPLGACAGTSSSIDSCTIITDSEGSEIGRYSTLYGWGLVNLEKATNPVGALWVHDGFTSRINPYVGVYTVSGSSLHLPGGTSQSLVSALPSYFTAFDSYNRPFAVDTKPLLNVQTKRKEFDTDFKAFMHGRDVTHVKANDQFSMAYAPRTSSRSSAMKTGLMEMNVDFDKTQVGFYYTEDTLNTRGNYFERALNNPFVQIQEAYGAEATYKLTPKLSIGMSYATGKNGFLGDGDKHYKAPDNRVSMVATEANYQAGKSVMFKASYGVVKEQDSVLGMMGSGAFKLKGASTNFASAGVEIKPTEKFKLSLAYTYGWTTPEKSDSLMNLSRLTADGFAAVAQYDLGSDNMVGLSISSPLRIRSGKVAFNLPVGRSSTDDTIYRETFTGSMKPTARELDFALFYKDALTDSLSIQSEVGLRLHPDHNKEASTDYRALFGLKWDY